MNIQTAVIPVAGLGTRLLPATKSQPKEMLPVGRKPVVQYVVEELAAAGVSRVLFVTGPGKTSIENHFDHNFELVQHLRETGKEELLAELAFEQSNIQFFYTRQRRPLGLGHAVLCAEPFLRDEPFVVALGDSIIGLHGQSNILRRMHDCFTENHAAAVVALEHVPAEDVSRYGIAKSKGTGEADVLDDIVEKPSMADAPSDLAVAARYILTPAIFDELRNTLPGKNGELQLTDAIRSMIRRGERVYGVCLSSRERRYDIGSVPSYYRAFLEFALADEQYGEGLRTLWESLRNAHHP